jgi:hypothetical protein
MASIPNKTAPNTAEDQLSPEERWALIERVAAGEPFSRSVRLRDFLLYVGKQSLREDNPEIHEQEIGAKVFGRPASYDRSSDNIVRVNATELRKRIDSWFSTSGAQEPWVFEIPRGSYMPVFRRRVAEPAPLSAPVQNEFPLEITPAPVRNTAAQSHPDFFAHMVWPVVCVLLTVGCAWLFWQNRTMRRQIRPWEYEPAVAAFWTKFLHSDRQTDIVLPDSSVSVSEEFTGHPVTLSEYLDQSYISGVQSSDMSTDRKADLDRIFSHNLVTFGDLRAAQQILALDPLSSSIEVTAARFYSADSIKRDNVILIGGRKANPWVFLFENQMNFSLDQDNRTLTMYVVNHHPLPGEQAIYRESSNQQGSIGYGVIAYLPSPSRTGDAVIFAGTGSNATNAAAEFLTSEDQVEQFRRTIRVSRLPYFEVLLQTSQLSGTSFGVKIVAFRTYPGLH